MRIAFFFLILVQGCVAQQQPDRPLAFPGADGFGKYTTGGRGGKTYVVTNLNDHGPGSFREAIKMSGPRVIVFSISGTIILDSELTISSGDLTIAGQSAPGDGICIRNYPVIVNAGNVVIRYLRFRMGDVAGQQADDISCLRQKDVIIDHCSMSWATDECASFYDNENFTLQWCIISESLNASVHEKGEHGYGGIWGGMGASFHHNLLAHHNSRNPRFCGSRYHHQPDREIVDFRNNVIYNWKGNSAYAGERGQHNMVNNYYKPGPATTGSKRRVLIQPYQPYGKFYLLGNILEGNKEVTSDNFLGVICTHPDSARTSQPFPFVIATDQHAADAFDAVLKDAGASFHRDEVDSRIITEVRQGTASGGKLGIIDSQNDVGGWPELKSKPALRDRDQDGMPDEWERLHRLKEEDPADASAFTLSKTYSNIEVYLNELVK